MHGFGKCVAMKVVEAEKIKAELKTCAKLVHTAFRFAIRTDTIRLT